MYINVREAVPAQKILNEMGHRQPRTPMQTDNSAAHSVLTYNVHPKRTKSMEISFYWLRLRDAQDQFRYYWRLGSQNWADCWTKNFPAFHHINMRPEFLTPARHLEDIKKLRMKEVCSVGLAQVISDSSPSTRVC